MTYLKREDLSRLMNVRQLALWTICPRQLAPIRHMLAYRHARGITNIDGLASSLFIRVCRTLILSVNVCNFQVPMWTLQSAETEIYSYDKGGGGGG